MSKTTTTILTLATIATLGAYTAQADEVQTTPETPTEQVEKVNEVYVSNINVTTLDGKNINSGVIDLEWGEVITIKVKVSYYGGEIPVDAHVALETLTGAFVTTLDENGGGYITFGLSNRYGGDTQLLHIYTTGFASDAPQTITANMSEHEEELPPIIDPDDNMEQPGVKPDETIPAIPLEPAVPVDPETPTPEVPEVKPDPEPTPESETPKEEIETPEPEAPKPVEKTPEVAQDDVKPVEQQKQEVAQSTEEQPKEAEKANNELTEASNEDMLPATGEQVNGFAIVAGLILIFVSVIGSVWSRKKGK